MHQRPFILLFPFKKKKETAHIMAQPFYGPPEVEQATSTALRAAGYSSNAFSPGCTFLIRGHPTESNGP